MEKLRNILFEDVKLKFTNFEGVETDYNTQGDRNFAVDIENIDDAIALQELGWNVRIKDFDGESTATLSVALGKFGIPKIVMLVESVDDPGVMVGTVLTEDTVGLLDSAEIISADLEVNPYHYPARGVTPAGVKAYLTEMYVVVQPQQVQRKVEAKYNIVY